MAQPRRIGHPEWRTAGRRRLVLGDTRDMVLTPITAETDDGQTWDGLRLVNRAGPRHLRRTAVIVVHGSVGNYLTGVPRRMAHGLAHAGYTVLTVNTRMANYGVFFGGGLFHRTPRDIDAWVNLARRMGHTDVVLLGFSLGASMVTYYQATNPRPEVVALATLVHPLSLPSSLKRRWERFGSIPSYDAVVRAAWAKIGGTADHDEMDDEIFIVRRATGPTDEPEDAEIWTYRTWWFSRGPQAYAAMSSRHIGELRVPILLVQAADDLIVPTTDGDELEQIALESGVPSVHHVVIDGADHVFEGRIDAVMSAVTDWMDMTVLPLVTERNGPR